MVRRAPDGMEQYGERYERSHPRGRCDQMRNVGREMDEARGAGKKKLAERKPDKSVMPPKGKVS